MILMRKKLIPFLHTEMGSKMTITTQKTLHRCNSYSSENITFYFCNGSKREINWLWLLGKERSTKRNYYMSVLIYHVLTAWILHAVLTAWTQEEDEWTREGLEKDNNSEQSNVITSESGIKN